MRCDVLDQSCLTIPCPLCHWNHHYASDRHTCQSATHTHIPVNEKGLTDPESHSCIPSSNRCTAIMYQESGLPPQPALTGDDVGHTRYPLTLDSAPAYHQHKLWYNTYVEETPQHQSQDQRICQQPLDFPPTMIPLLFGDHGRRRARPLFHNSHIRPHPLPSSDAGTTHNLLNAPSDKRQPHDPQGKKRNSHRDVEIQIRSLRYFLRKRGSEERSDRPSYTKTSLDDR